MLIAVKLKIEIIDFAIKICFHHISEEMEKNSLKKNPLCLLV